MQKPGARTTASVEEIISPMDDTDLPECQFVSVDTLRNTLTGVLGITSGDTQIIYPTANSGLYLRDRRVQLGALPAGANSGVTNSNCGTLKYKVASELMINACQQANPQNLAALFPGGLSSSNPSANNYNTIYRVFMGRNPDAEEIEVLNTLVGQVSQGVAQAAVCAAVSSSIEALSKNM